MAGYMGPPGYDASMRPMMMAPHAHSYPAVPTQRVLSAPRSTPATQYRDDFGSPGVGSPGGWGTRDLRDPSWDTRGLSPARAPPMQERYGAPQTQRLDDECAEDECLDADQCGAENRPPKPENLVCGIDTRPLLPIGLAVSTVVGGLLMILLQVPLLSRLSGISEMYISASFLLLYAITLGCMTYCAFSDPGQMRKDRSSGPFGSPGSDDGQQLPQRAHKSWQYKRAIRRYDHYCRWLSNCIGLLNHREFVIMLIGLVAIGLLGVAVDLTLIASMLNNSWWQTLLLISLHLGYSVGLIALAMPILRIHTGLVSRNELAAEWKRNDFYVAKSAKRGKDVPVSELSDDEFNTLFDEFVYDKSKNTFDHGCLPNCFRFWCLPRWRREEMGEF